MARANRASRTPCGHRFAGGAAPDPRGREHAEAFARTEVEAFRYPEAMVPWIAAIVGRPGWRHWGAFDRDEPAAAARCS